MKFRHFALAAATLAAIAPAFANAGSENAALNACASAFASSIANPGSAAPTFRLKYLGAQTEGGMGVYYGRQFTFFLQAHDSKTGLPLAQATCSATMGGRVLALTQAPLKGSLEAKL